MSARTKAKPTADSAYIGALKASVLAHALALNGATREVERLRMALAAAIDVQKWQQMQSRLSTDELRKAMESEK